MAGGPDLRPLQEKGVSLSNFTQPVCERCWRMAHYDADPVKLHIPVPERCCLCGAMTRDGIYERLDPRIVPYPQEAQA